MIFSDRSTGSGEILAVKRKSPHLSEGFKTWCGLLCAYRTQITEDLKEKLQKIQL